MTLSVDKSGGVINFCGVLFGKVNRDMGKTWRLQKKQ
jgi:hypothetical protein